MQATPQLEAAISLMRERAETLVQLADLVSVFTAIPKVSEELKAQHLLPNAALLAGFSAVLTGLAVWDKESIADAIQQTLKQAAIKMPQLAIPVRVAVFGTTQTPGVDAMLTILGKSETLNRLNNAL
jgi:glutamyl-tRNA synthetase